MLECDLYSMAAHGFSFLLIVNFFSKHVCNWKKKVRGLIRVQIFTGVHLKMEIQACLTPVYKIFVHVSKSSDFKEMYRIIHRDTYISNATF